MKTTQILNSLAMVAAITALVGPEAAVSQDATLASAPVAEVVEIPAMKSEGKATLLSLAGTAIPMTLGAFLASGQAEGAASSLGLVLFSCGMYFGPATGYWYAGASGAAWKGAAVRLGISLATVGLTAAICSGDNCPILGSDSGNTAIAGIVALAALGATTFSLIHDIAGVDSHVRRHNADVAARQGSSRLTIAPVVSPADGGTVGVYGKIRL